MIASQVRILVVDDERNIRNNLTMVLESAGYKVDATGDGEDALTKCKERHYDIALVDIQMPKMGGLELLRYLRTLRPNLAVVILTAYGTVGSAVEAMKLGAVDFLEKPFDPKVLLFLCEEIIQRQKTTTKGSVDDLAPSRRAGPRAESLCRSPCISEDCNDTRGYTAGALLLARLHF